MRSRMALISRSVSLIANSAVIRCAHAEQSENLTLQPCQLGGEYKGWLLTDDQRVSPHVLKQVDHAPRCGTAARATLGVKIAENRGGVICLNDTQLPRHMLACAPLSGSVAEGSV